MPVDSSRTAPEQRRLPTWAATAATLLVILAAAAFLRLWQLDQSPPGLNHDEGVNALDVETIIAGARPIFLPTNNGREAMFMYFQAIVGAVLGVTPTSLRLAAAISGLATVAATFGLARSWYGRRIGLLTCGLLATAFWHVVLSRVGLRAILAPLFYLLVFWALAEGLRQGRTWLYVAAGVLLGAAEYTYISARLLPGIVLLVCVVLLWRLHRRGQAAGRFFVRLLLAAGAAGVTVLPEAIYFVRHPETLIGRTDQVLVFSKHPAIIGTSITFRQSVRRTFGMFWVQGDTNWLHNIAGLPVLDPLLALAFLVGTGITVAGVVHGVRVGRQRQWAKPRPMLTNDTSGDGPGFPPVGMPPTQQAQYATDELQADVVWPDLWLLVWCAVLLAGSSVTQESPNYLRLTALMPAIALLCARGADGAVQALVGFLRGRGVRLTVAWSVALLALLVVGEGVRTGYLYFGNWDKQPGVYTAFDTDIREAAAAAGKVTGVPISDTTVQLDASSPYLFFRPASADARWLREYSTVVTLPLAGQPALWVYSHFQVTPPLPSYLPTAHLLAQGDARPGHPGYFLYALDAAALGEYRQSFTPPAQPQQFGGQLALLGVRMESTTSVGPGSTLVVSLLWQVLTAGAVNFGASVHLDDGHGVTWAQSDRQGMMRSGWHAGDVFVSRHELAVPQDTPPIALHLDAGAELLDPLNQPAAVLQTLGAPVTVASVRVLPAPAGTATPPAGAQALVAGLYLTGADLRARTLKPGESLPVVLRWLRTGPLPPLSVKIAYVDSRQETVAELHGDAGYGAEPFAELPLGQVVADPRQVTVSAGTAPGPLQIVVVASNAQSGAPVGKIIAGSVNVVDRVHEFALPSPRHVLRATFGNQIDLLGYDLSSATPTRGAALTVTLYWRALATPDRDYTVFVHLLNREGKIVAQNDSQPGNNTLPTRGWLPAEVVADQHAIALPATLLPGAYHLELGWYDGASGARLALAAPPQLDHLDAAQVIEVR